MYKTISVLLFAIINIQLLGQENSKQQFNSDNEELSVLNAQFIQNFLHNDTVAHNKIVYKDFICIASNGAVINRDDYMKGWVHGYDPAFYRSFKMQNEWIRIFGNMALVRAETYYSFMEDSKEIFKTTIYTDTYIKLEGRWWCIQAQLTSKK